MRAFPVSILFALAVASCKPSREAPAPPDPPDVPAVPQPPVPALVAVAFCSLEDPHSNAISQAMREEAASAGFDLRIVSAGSSVATQRAQIHDFVAMKAKAIAILPCGPTAIGEAIREANLAGIPVFTFRTECRAPGAEIVAHTGAGEALGGHLAALALIEAIGESGGEIVIIDARPEDSRAERIRGFRETIGRFNASRPANEASLRIAAEIAGNGTREEGMSATARILPVLPGLIGIFAANDTAALGAADALEKAGRQDRVALVAAGHSLEARRAIRYGRIYAAAVLDPGEIGRQTLGSIREYLDGKDVAPSRTVGFQLYRKADAVADPGLE